MSNKIYRIQDREGRGPYKPGETELWQDKEGEALPPLPIPAILKFRRSIPKDHHMGFGFQSMEQLRNWFSDGEISRLYYRGFQIVSMGATGILMKDGKQVLFHRRFPFNEGCEAVKPWQIPNFPA